ncbi:hypothetical protein GMDG_04462 [Pseudogymnoascus destructans 20631-21]|uniref:DUF3074 domain-containing protein n=1 Tax=Pseudogymnoascus destructans (strain ATCC MYA-4855 / 20631-21) TaxID=658429 RepID=L8GD88_PSED2|nr:hypothetical protein GMDG_04462 [Pseudogymnoascus destructans 20631-21]
MAALQNALQTLSPIDAITVPQSPTDLETFLNTTFDTSQLLIDSVPLPAPASLPTRPRSSTTTSIASSASEITLSSARPDSPPPDVSKLQKAWGKPLRLAAKDNPLGMSVYKLAGTDGKGAWFARRSVHCGLGFERWKRALQQEFPETMKIDGGPGVSNIRGIGGERCVECREVGGGKMEVYHLSAQFPGPTTPRDFVTMLMTTERREERGPRQFMIVSKPCIHPQTPVRDGFIRGQYQSVELIREVPVLPPPTKSASMNDLAATGQPAKPPNERKRAESQASSLNRSAVVRNANSSHPSRTPSEDRRQRGHTISFAGSRGVDGKGEYHDIPADDPERNPVEWIMLTRSDPGGSVPRFMVERGTPGSIVADAAKFLNWACSAALDVVGDEVPPRVDGAAESASEREAEIEHPVVPGEEPRPGPPHAPRAHPPPRASTEISLREFQTNGHLASLDGIRDPPPNEHYTPHITTASLCPPEQNNRGVLSMVTNAASAISNFLPSAGYAAALPHAQLRERRYSTSSSSSSEEEEGEGETDLGSSSGGSFMSFASARERGSFDDADESADAASVDAASVPPVYGVPAPMGPSSSEESTVLPDAAIRTEPLRPSSSSSLVVEDAGVLRARRRAAAAIEKEEGKFRERKRRLVEKIGKVRRKEGGERNCEKRRRGMCVILRGRRAG